MRNHDQLVFPLHEYERRLENVRTEMRQRGIELMLINSPDNLVYLTGHETSGYDQVQLLFVPLEGEPFAVCRFAERDNFLTRTWLDEPRIYSFTDVEDPVAVIVGTLAAEKIGRVRAGIEHSTLSLSYLMHKQFEAELPLDLVDASGTVERGRLVKSKYEIDLIKDVARITEVGMRAGIDAAVPGASENDVAAAVHHAMYSAGGEYPAVPPYITSGPRTIICHATWCGRVLAESDLVFLEIAGCLKRYHAAMMRSVYLGEPPRILKQAEEMVNDDIETLKAAMVPGATAHDIDTLAHHGRYAKFGATRFSRAGYSLGIAFAPSWDEGQILSLNRGDQTPLRENMVFHLIPWLQFPDENLVMGLSETVVVTPSGAQSVFTLERKLYLK